MGWPRPVLLMAAFWTTVGLVFALPRLAAGGAWSTPLLSSLAEWWSWGLLAPLIVALDRRLPFGSGQPVARLLAHLICGPVVTAVYIYVYTIAGALLQVQPWSRLIEGHPLHDALQGMFLWALLVYCLIVGGWWAYQSHHRYVAAELQMERLERNYSEARLNALRLQLDPHFLFNALNTISAQVQSEPKLARKMIEHLGDLLRLSLDPKSRHEITLADELAFLDHYLAIQKIRFGDKLNVELAIAADVRDAAVPSLFMQPLVENAIRHGFSRRARGGRITVTANRRGAMLDIRIADDGDGLPPGWSLEGQAGLGLQVTRERIAGFHPDGDSRFEVGPRAEGGTDVAIAFPFRVLEPNREESHVDVGP